MRRHGTDMEMAIRMRQSGKPTENETGHANVIVMPDVYRADPMVVVHERFILVEGKIQNQDGIVHVKAERIMPLNVSSAGPESHDFH
jgi:error-prone DNA polymerase